MLQVRTGDSIRGWLLYPDEPFMGMHWALKTSCGQAYIRPRKPWTDHIATTSTSWICICPVVECSKKKFFLTRSLLFVLQIQLSPFGFAFHSNASLGSSSSNGKLTLSLTSYPSIFPRCCFESDDLFDDESECFDVERFSRYVVTC